MNILLKNATIIDSKSPYHNQTKDLFIQSNIIQKIGTNISDKNIDKIIENVYISQGWVDSSVSFGEPGYEERETLKNGMLTAGKSGFTQILINPNTNPIIDTKQDVIFIRQQTQDCISKAFPIGALSVGSKGEHLAELFDMKNGGAVAFGDYKKPILSANLLKIALQYTQNFGGIVIAFPLDKSIAGKGIVNEHITSTKLGLKGIPTLAEYLYVARDLKVLEYSGGKLHIPTVSCTESLDLIREAKRKGLNVTCSVAIHNIHFTDEVLTEFDTNYKVLPPLRDTKNVNAIRQALTDGTIDFVTSDHHPLDIECKFKEFDHASYGTIGLETAFGILQQYVSTERAIELLTKAKERFGLPNSIIKEGEISDITIFNPNLSYTFEQKDILSTSKNSAFIGQKMRGKVLGIITERGFLSS